MAVIFGVMSVVCLVYFGIISVYSGVKTSAAWVWLVLAIVFFLLFRGSHYYHQHKNKVPLWVPVSVVTLCTAGAVIFVILQMLIFGGMIGTAPEHLDYLIVLGAKVREDDISASLKHRLDKAIRFAQEHPETKLILSGGQGKDEPTTEAQAMAEYLQYNGIAPEQILLEGQSTSTRENMTFSKALIEEQRQEEKESVRRKQVDENRRRMELSMFLLQLEKEAAEKEKAADNDLPFSGFAGGQGEREQAMIEKDYRPPKTRRSELTEKSREFLAQGGLNRQRSYDPGYAIVEGAVGQGQNLEALMQVYPGVKELLPDKPLQIGVLTSNFHLFRAMKIGEKCGFEHLYGVASSSDPILFVHLCVREGMAILKDKFLGNM
ncbi:MAG: YdcF family protein [Lachnospiraceae bacterium]|nr:YdcF family protein [Lachnospiraceae bacterium]